MPGVTTVVPTVHKDARGFKYVVFHCAAADGTLFTTNYLTKAEARDLAKRLYDAACEIKDKEAGT